MSGDLGFIDGVRPEDVVEERDGVNGNGNGKDLDKGVVIKSQSELYQTPQDVFLLLMERAHLAEPMTEEQGQDFVVKTGQEKIDYNQMAGELLHGSGNNIEEMMRFRQLVLFVKDHISELVDAYDRAREAHSVREIVAGTRSAAVLESFPSASAMGLLLASEDFLQGVSYVEKGEKVVVDHEWIAERVSGLAYAVERRIHALTGLAS